MTAPRVYLTLGLLDELRSGLHMLRRDVVGVRIAVTDPLLPTAAEDGHRCDAALRRVWALLDRLDDAETRLVMEARTP